MSTPITWGDYVLWVCVAPFVTGIAIVALFGAIESIAHPKCQTCGRRLYWRWRKRHEYDSHRYCPFHDSDAP